MDTESNQSESGQVKTAVSDTIHYLKDLATAGPAGVAGRGFEMGLSAVLGRTALRHLPAPLNLVAPLLIERIIMKHGIEEGRELLLKGLYWVKKVTDDEAIEIA